MRLPLPDFRLYVPILLTVILGMLLAGPRSTFAQSSDSAEIPDGITLHVVASEESLAQIAQDYDVPLSKLMTANDLAPGESASAGDRLLIPGTAGSARALYDEAYIVTETDNLFTLAQLSDTDVEALGLALSAVNPFGLYVGQSLQMAPIERTFDGGREDTLHRIGVNQSLVTVALRYDVPLYALSEANHYPNPLIVPDGALVRVPNDAPAASTNFHPWVSVSVTPQPVQTGRTVSVVIQTATPGTMSGRFLDQDVPFVSEDTLHRTVIGVSRWQEPGVYRLDLTFLDDTGQTSVIALNLKVTYGGYISESLRIPEDIAVVLNDPQAVQAEISYVASVMSGFTPAPIWNGAFLLPASGVTTSSYGTLRSYNGSGFNTFHSGADLAARTGTPIYAPADGVVVNIAELDVRGLVTMIDHGFGVYTGYWHQSSILVEPGDTVVRGQQIGSIGSTGLSTAAHLHWELWIRGTQVDAMQWVRESFP